MDAFITLERRLTSLSHQIYEVLDHSQDISQVKAKEAFKLLLSSLDFTLCLTVHQGIIKEEAIIGRIQLSFPSLDLTYLQEKKEQGPVST